MERRAFVSGTLGLLFTPLATAAQPGRHVPARIGYLGNASFKTPSEQLEAFRQGLRDLGWIEGETLVIEYRWADGQLERLPALAAELARLKTEVIVVAGIQGID